MDSTLDTLLTEQSEKEAFNFVYPYCEHQFPCRILHDEFEMTCPKCEKSFAGLFATVASKRQSYQEVEMRLQYSNGDERMIYFKSKWKMGAKHGDKVMFYFKKKWLQKDYSKEPAVFQNFDISSYAKL